MCGIVYAQNFNGEPVNNAILQAFDNQRARGTEGFGLFDGQEMNLVRSAGENKILKWLVKYDSNLILFHHRRPTSTINVKKAAHPFATKKFFGDTQYVLVHNGSINNASKLYAEHKESGIEYQSLLQDGTFNDSEALLWDFALTMEGKQQQLKATGYIAFICMKITNGKLDKLYFGRNTNPLIMKKDKNGIMLSSEGEGDPIQSQQLYTWDYGKNKLKQRPFVIPTYTYSPVKNYNSDDYDWNWQNNHSINHISANSSGSWLPEYLREKYRSQLAKMDEKRLSISSIGDDPVIDYDRDGDPIYASDIEYNDYDDYYTKTQGRKHKVIPTTVLTDEEMEDMELDEPTELEIQKKVNEYIAEAKGNFEMAYWLAENDYDEVIAFEDDKYAYKEVRLLEEVMSCINSDKEYIDENSISSKWGSLCQQKLAV